MAEPEQEVLAQGLGGQESAPAPAPAPAPGPESEGYTADELRGMIRDEVGAHLQGFAQALDNRLAPVEAIGVAVRDLMGRSAKTEALIDRMFRGTMTDADLAAVDAKLEQDGLRAKLQEREDADRRAAERAAAQQRSGNDGVDQTWNSIIAPDLVAYAEGQGVAYAQVYPSFPKTLNPSRGDTTGWLAFVRAARAAIDRQADADRKAAAPRTKVDATRPAGTKEPADLSKGGLSLFQKHYENRQRA